MSRPNTSKNLHCRAIGLAELAKNGLVGFGEFSASWRKKTTSGSGAGELTASGVIPR